MYWSMQLYKPLSLQIYHLQNCTPRILLVGYQYIYIFLDGVDESRTAYNMPSDLESACHVLLDNFFYFMYISPKIFIRFPIHLIIKPISSIYRIQSQRQTIWQSFKQLCCSINNTNNTQITCFASKLSTSLNIHTFFLFEKFINTLRYISLITIKITYSVNL